jgi:hypothetical protein
MTGDATSRRDLWLNGLKSGRTLATNGPLLGFTVDDKGPGSDVTLSAGDNEVQFAGFLRSAVPVDHLEIVYNGKVIRAFSSDEPISTADLSGTLDVDKSGWLLLRAWNDNAHPLVFDLYPYATTNPVFVSIDGERPRSAADADYFLAWIGRIRESVESHTAFNDDSERAAIIENLAEAEQRFKSCR